MLNVKRKVLFLMLVAALYTGVSLAQSQKTGVKFDCTCNDPVGARYATDFRDVLATSPRYTEAKDFIEGKGDNAVWHWGIRAVSLDPSAGNLGTSTVLSITFTFGPIYYDTLVQTCNSDTLKSCAESTMAALDKDIAALKS